MTGARIAQTKAHFLDPATHGMNVIMLITSAAPSDLLYALLKGPTTHEMLDWDDTVIGRMLHKHVDLLESWGMPGSDWEVLAHADPEWAQNEHFMHVARHHIVSLDAGCYRNLVLVYTESPYTGHHLLSTRRTEAEKNGVASTMVEHFCCKGPLCGQRLMQLCPTVLEMLSPFGLAILAAILELIDHGGVPRVELAHALHRHWLHYQGQGFRGPRHLAARHICHVHFEEFMAINPDLRESLLDVLRDFAKNNVGVGKILDVLRSVAPSTRKKIVGGNPKMTFMNAYVHAAKTTMGRTHGASSMTEDDHHELQVEALMKWETEIKDDAELYANWYPFATTI